MTAQVVGSFYDKLVCQYRNKMLCRQVKRRPVGPLSIALGATLGGVIVFFCAYGILARSEGLLGTFIASVVAGAIGLLTATVWLRVLPKGNMLQALILFAYIARIIIGVAVYIESNDATYFSGNGKYKTIYWEYYWTYDNATRVADNIEKYGLWRPSDSFKPGENKNENIHTWMGWYLASGKSRNALDLASFNSFHHCVAGSLIIAMAISLGYSLRASGLAGLVTAWIPWSFPATLMWRDSVGLAWVVLAVALIIYARPPRGYLSWIVIIPAVLLSFSTREVYINVVICGLVYLWANYVFKGNNTIVRQLLKLLISIGCLFVTFSYYDGLQATVYGRYADIESTLIERMFVMPLLFIRAIAGPFPWGSNEYSLILYVMFDYAFHVLQLAVLYVTAKHWRTYIMKLNVMTVAASILFVTGVIAPGVHTAYLAVALPFIMPFIFETGEAIRFKVVVSAIVFLAINAAYYLSGLHGGGWIIRQTGY